MKELYFIAAGGTGGHIFPAEALQTQFLAENFETLFLTDYRYLKYSLTLKENYRIISSYAPKKHLWSIIKGIFYIFLGIKQSWSLINHHKPKAVIAFGGYPVLPVLLAAWLKKIPIYLVELNTVLGLVNKLLSCKAKKIAINLPLIDDKLSKKFSSKLEVVGMPIRQQFIPYGSKNYQLSRPIKKLKILVFGGSQGAKIFANIIPQALINLSKNLAIDFEIVQQCHKDQIETLEQTYGLSKLKVEIASFFNDIHLKIDSADLIICRAGASTIAEIAFVGRPAILVPYRYAKDNHQFLNAKLLEKAGATITITEDLLTVEHIISTINDLIQNPSKLFSLATKIKAFAKPEATKNLFNMVVNDVKLSNN